MLSLDEAILHAEEVATEQELLMGRYDAASGYARSGNESIRTESAKECEKCADEHRQLATWLRELQERRKAPEICYCKDCKAIHCDFCLRTLKPVRRKRTIARGRKGEPNEWSRAIEPRHILYIYSRILSYHF